MTKYFLFKINSITTTHTVSQKNIPVSRYTTVYRVYRDTIVPLATSDHRSIVVSREN